MIYELILTKVGRVCYPLCFLASCKSARRGSGKVKLFYREIERKTMGN